MLGQSVRWNVPKSTSWFVKIADPALLYMVDRCLNALEKIWTDGIIRPRTWEQFTKDLEKEWEKSLIMVCLLFSCPPGFREQTGPACIIRMLTSFLKPSGQSTVLLAVNVSFLAIPVTSGGSQSSLNQQLWSSPAGLACQVSITASVASIIFGSLLQRQQNRSPNESADKVVCTCVHPCRPFYFSIELENK